MNTKILEILETLWISSTQTFFSENDDETLEEAKKDKPTDPPKKIKAFTD